MDPMKQSYDTLGENAWETLNYLYLRPRPASLRTSIVDEPDSALHSHDRLSEGKRDLYVLLHRNYFNDKALSDLWAEVNNVPSWVCWEQIARGQDCFYRYGGPILNGLAFQSLLGGMVTSLVLLT